MIKISLDVKQSICFSVFTVKTIFLMLELFFTYTNMFLLFFMCLFIITELLFCIYMILSKIENMIIFKFSIYGLIFNFNLLFYIYVNKYVNKYNLNEVKFSLINVIIYFLIYLMFNKYSVKLYHVNNSDLERYGKECIICLEEMSIKISSLQKLKCNHVFHKDCISKYLGYNNHLEEVKCPTCRC